MRKLVIDRKVWLRGERASYLLRRHDRKMCCVGIYLKACGVPEEKFKGLAGIISVPEKVKFPEEAEWLRGLDTLLYGLYAVNDALDLTEIQREAKIVKLFAQRDVEVTFIN